MIVDNKQFTPKTATAAAVVAPGTLWVASQIPGLVVSKDVTDVLIQRGFWPSYNIPYFPDLWSILGYESLVKQYGSWGGGSDSKQSRRSEAGRRELRCKLAAFAPPAPPVA